MRNLTHFPFFSLLSPAFRPQTMNYVTLVTAILFLTFLVLATSLSTAHAASPPPPPLQEKESKKDMERKGEKKALLTFDPAVPDLQEQGLST